MKGLSKFVWNVFLWVVIPLILYTVYQGFVLGEIELPGGIRMTFQKNLPTMPESVQDRYQDLSKEERDDRTEALQRQVDDLRDELNRRPSSSASFDLSGSWRGYGGARYQIYQNGSYFTIQELSPYGIPTAVGEGQINGRSLTLTYQTAVYTYGSGVLTISADGQSMSGYFQDNTYGTRINVTLRR